MSMRAAVPSVSQPNGVLQSTPAHFDAAKAAPTNVAARAAMAQNPAAIRFQAILEQEMPDVALAFKQKRMTPQQEERASGQSDKRNATRANTKSGYLGKAVRSSFQVKGGEHGTPRADGHIEPTTTFYELGSTYRSSLCTIFG
jgi:hypothetical protein